MISKVDLNSLTEGQIVIVVPAYPGNKKYAGFKYKAELLAVRVGADGVTKAFVKPLDGRGSKAKYVPITSIERGE